MRTRRAAPCSLMCTPRWCCVEPSWCAGESGIQRRWLRADTLVLPPTAAVFCRLPSWCMRRLAASAGRRACCCAARCLCCSSPAVPWRQALRIRAPPCAAPQACHFLPVLCSPRQNRCFDDQLLHTVHSVRRHMLHAAADGTAAQPRIQIVDLGGFAACSGVHRGVERVSSKRCHTVCTGCVGAQLVRSCCAQQEWRHQNTAAHAPLAALQPTCASRPRMPHPRPRMRRLRAGHAPLAPAPGP